MSALLIFPALGYDSNWIHYCEMVGGLRTWCVCVRVCFKYLERYFKESLHFQMECILMPINAGQIMWERCDLYALFFNLPKAPRSCMQPSAFNHLSVLWLRYLPYPLILQPLSSLSILSCFLFLHLVFCFLFPPSLIWNRFRWIIYWWAN